MSESGSNRTVTVGELIARLLEATGLTAAFGVISIHNMPILDAFGRRDRIRFVPARSEQGAVNMADAYARVSGGIGVAVSSTGTAAGNTCGALVEALTAGTPVVHFTGQIDTPYLDRNLGFIHEARDQLAMLRAVSKAAYRVASPAAAYDIVREAIATALTPPMGPVSIEIPIDVQAATVALPTDLSPLRAGWAPAPAPAAVDELAKRLAAARRPLIWLGGGARGASAPAERLARLGFGIVSSVQGRGIVDERSPMSLGAFNLHAPVEQFYASCDAMLVVGSRLRSNETLAYKLKLPQPLYRIDVDAAANQRAYPNDLFLQADAALTLSALADRLSGKVWIESSFADELATARAAAERLVRDGLGPYSQLVDVLQAAVGRDFLWVRDVTVSNSTWGNRLPRLAGPRDGVHAMGGGIGQGIQMALGAALAANASGRRRKTVCLSGDGGLMVNVGELATLVQEKADVVVIVMNDRGYGVIKNIQDAIYGGRRYYADLHTPDFAMLAQSIALPHHRITDLTALPGPLAAAIERVGPTLIEIDMTSIGPFARAFAGPPVRKDTNA